MAAPFDPDTMPPDSLTVLLGKRRTGKTTLAAHLASRKAIVAVFYGSCSDVRAWSEKTPDTTHVAEFQEEGFSDSFRSQCLARPRGCVVIDNCFFYRGMNDVLENLAVHAGLGAIITALLAIDIHPTFSGVRYWLAVKDEVNRACSDWLSAEAFHAVYAEVTAQPYTALVVDSVDQKLWSYAVPVKFCQPPP